ncbi:MAG TPA: DUF2264 domain-containing protein [Bacteroidales bacterium]|nr:DUF2264 domain-containing protein [Bacteroidales bacterium]
MERRAFVKIIPAGALGTIFPVEVKSKERKNIIVTDCRDYWLLVLKKIADPVLRNLSREQLRANMPLECKPGEEVSRKEVTHLEAFGRLIAGISPWLELGFDQTDEGRVRGDYIELARTCLSVATNPNSPDCMNFSEGLQPLVDAAFLAHGLLRGYHQLWDPLDIETKKNIVDALRSTRIIKPYYSNWLLFSAMIETFFLKAGYEWDSVRIDYAIKKHLEWYKGDGIYGDGPEFHWDYYNSFVIQPMLLDILMVLTEEGLEKRALYNDVLNRAKRYAAILERLISPDGTFPPIGRSLAYRFGVFQLLGQLALYDELPECISPAQARSAMSAVISKMAEAPGMFDDKGWLTIGFYGHQPSSGESYISTGSLYLCATGLLPLGLPPGHNFWTLPSADWTQKKIWRGDDFLPDHALLS